MRRSMFIAAMLLLFPLRAMAQETPTAEFFGGYSYFHRESGDNLNGWNASIAANLNKWFGLVADFSGHYDSSSSRFQISQPGFPLISTSSETTTRLHTFMMGPRFSYRKNEKITPFAHILLGAARLHNGFDATFSGGHTSFSFNSTRFSGAVGGGLDVRLSKLLALRVVQAEYVFQDFGSSNHNHARVSVGLVFRFSYH